MKKAIKWILLLFLLFLAAAGGFLLGRNSLPEQESNTFYATIDAVEGKNLLVSGLDVNDINFRGRFSFSVTEDTKLEWRYTEITWDDFRVGQNIAITFRGEIQETEPAGISNVSKIQLLEDSLEQ